MRITPEIEAVARAIARSDDADPDYCIEHNGKLVPFWTLRIENAIAAIRALREPTSRQIVAGLHEDLGPYDVATSYTAMIDAALGEHHDA